MLHLEDAQVLLHLTDVAGGLGHVGPLLVPLGQQLLDVLLLLLQGFLQRGGARDLAGVARRRLGQLRRGRTRNVGTGRGEGLKLKQTFRGRTTWAGYGRNPGT